MSSQKRDIKRDNFAHKNGLFFTKTLITQKPFDAGIRNSDTLDKNVISILGINFKLLSVIGAE